MVLGERGLRRVPFDALLLLVALSVFSLPARAQTTPGGADGSLAAGSTRALVDSIRPVVERAMSAADWATIDAIIVRLRRAHAAVAGDPWLAHDLAYALHRRASAAIIEGRARDARPLLEEAIAAAQRAQRLGAGAQVLALEGAVTGQLAGVAGGFSAIRLGPRSFRLLDAAVAALPNDPRVALLNGISRLNAPRAFGGGAAKGEPELRRAVRLFAQDPNRSPAPIWGRVDAHIWLGIALKELNRPAEAREQWQQALKLAPDHRWVTDQLLPSLGAR